MEELRRVGGAVFSFVPPDVLRLEWSSQLEPEAVEAMRSITDELRARHGGSVMLLVDLRNANTVTPAARKKLVEVSRESPWGATAMVGASFKMRVLVNLISKAVRLVMPSPSHTEFFETEEQAMRWLGEQRAPLRA